MLDYFRKQSNSLVSTFLILVVAATMAFLWGTTKYDSSERDPDGVAAWVNGEAVTKREFAREYESLLYRYQSMLGNQFDEKFLQALQVPQHALESLVNNKLLFQQAKRVGISVPDQELADHIKNLPYFQKEGKFSQELYNRIPDKGREEKMQREALALHKFQGYLIDRVKFTPTELRNVYLMKETKVDLDYAEIQFEKLAESHKMTKEETDSFTKSAPEADFKKYYDEHLKDFSDPAVVELYQIRVGMPFQASPQKKDEAKAKIQSIHSKVTAENFSEQAKTQSDDEYAKKGGFAGWVKRGSLEPGLEKALDKLELNKVSTPIETPFGWYILKVAGKKDQVTKPLVDVKKTIGEKLALESYKKKFAETTRGDWEKKLATGNLEGELKKWKIEIKKTGPFSVGGGFVPNIGQLDGVMDGVFALSKKEPVAKKFVQVGDKYYYMKLRTLEYAKDQEFSKGAEVTEKGSITSLQGELLNRWINSLRTESNVKVELQLKGKPVKTDEG